MSSKSKSTVIHESPADSKPVEPSEASERNAAFEEVIRRCAHEIYLERGEQPGCELDDWPQAARELERLAITHSSWESDSPT
jgi:hypothetical protein